MNLFKLVGSVFVDTQDASKSLQGLDTSTEASANKLATLGTKLQTAGTKVTALGKSLAPVSAAATAMGIALYGAAKKTAATADNIDKMSQKLGLSREAYQEWDYVLSQSGLDIDDFSGGMKTLLKNMDAVTEGNETATENFKKLGVSVTDSNGKMRSQEDVLKDSVTALQNMEDGSEKARLAQELFGKQGQNLLPLLNGEAGSVDELMQKAEDLGLVMGDDAVDAGVEFTDTMDTFNRTLSTLVTTVGTAVMPYITQFVQYLTEHIPQVRDVIKGVADWFNNLSPALQKVITIVGVAAAVASPVLIVVGTIMTKIGSLLMILSKLQTAIALVSTVLGISSLAFVGIIAGIAAVIAIGVLLYKNWDKVTATAKKLVSVVVSKFKEFKTKVGEAFDKAKEKAQPFINMVKKVATTFNSVKTGVVNSAKAIYQSVKDKFDAAKKKIQPFIDILKKAKDTYDSFKKKVTGKFKFLDGLKIPKISISGGSAPFGIGGKGKKPSISVKWNAKAVDTPYMFSGATLFGAGETKDEILYGRQNLLNDIKEASQNNASSAEVVSLLSQILSQMVSMNTGDVPSRREVARIVRGMVKA